MLGRDRRDGRVHPSRAPRVIVISSRRYLRNSETPDSTHALATCAFFLVLWFVFGFVHRRFLESEQLFEDLASVKVIYCALAHIFAGPFFVTFRERASGR